MGTTLGLALCTASDDKLSEATGSWKLEALDPVTTSENAWHAVVDSVCVRSMYVGLTFVSVLYWGRNTRFTAHWENNFGEEFFKGSVYLVFRGWMGKYFW